MLIYTPMASQEPSQPLSQAQQDFNALSVDDKLSRLNELVSQSQVYSQIILENMMEKALDKKRQQDDLGANGANTADASQGPSASRGKRLKGRRHTKAASQPEPPATGSDENHSDVEIVEVRRSARNRGSDSTVETRIKKRRAPPPEPASKLRRSKRVQGSAEFSGVSAASGASASSTPATRAQSRNTKKALEQAQTAHNQQQPALVSGCTMKEYQLDGLEWLVTLYENGLNGILADEMGLGKTLQCISLFAHLLGHGVRGPYLVVVPLSTINNWGAEFERFAPGISVVKYVGSKHERRAMQLTRPRSNHVVITTYEVFLRDFARFKRVQWTYLAVDEGHRLKNFQSVLMQSLKRLDVGSRLLLTGTPLQNNLKELWSLLNFILPDIFHDLELFESWFDLDEFLAGGSYANEDERRAVRDKVQHDLVRNLHVILKPFMLRRVKSTVIKDLPPKKEYIVYVHMTPMQQLFTNAAINRKLLDTVVEMHLKESLLNSSGGHWGVQDLGLVDQVLAAQNTPAPVAAKRMRHARYNDHQLRQFEEVEVIDHRIRDTDSEYHEPGARGTRVRSSRVLRGGRGRSTDGDNEKDGDNDNDNDEGNDGDNDNDNDEGNDGDNDNDDENDDEENDDDENDDEENDDDENDNVTSEVIDIESDQELDPHSQRVERIKARLNHVRQESKSLALQNLPMQLRNICGSHYLYYYPFEVTTKTTEAQMLANDAALVHSLRRHSAKYQMLEKLVDSLVANNHKVLVFSQFSRALELASLMLESKGISHSMLTGSMGNDERNTEIADFKQIGKGASKVFLLTTRAGGLGLNLVEADTVILFDNDWNPQMDLQAIGRVHRIGQTRPVKVVRFVVKDSVEEILILRSFSKRALEKMVIRSNRFQVAEKLKADNLDVQELDSIKSLRDLDLGSYLSPAPAQADGAASSNQILAGLAQPSPQGLSQKELAEIMDRSPECYSRAPQDFANMTSIETFSET